MKRKPVVFLGMSGGVDSSVSALLLKQAGYEVVGVFIKTWHPDFIVCNETEERRDAMRVASFLDIPFLVFDFEKEYKEGVADYMIHEYKKGRTPNPDVMCNREIKFGAFMKKALSMGADFVSTGHYAQKKTAGHAFCQVLGCSPLAHPDHDKKHAPQLLLKSVDPTKDQSYFLWTLTQGQLERIIFPIGHLEKTEVRKIAKKHKLPVADKKDSQGICFLGEVNLKDFLKHYIKEKRGDVLNTEGEVIGYHEGAFFFTLGERHGFTITRKTASETRLYVVDKNIKDNTITVSPDVDSSKNTSRRIIRLENPNWINEIPLKEKKYQAQIRYHGEEFDCSVNTSSIGKTEISFTKNILVASGQSVVVYDGEVCLGGGIVI